MVAPWLRVVGVVVANGAVVALAAAGMGTVAVALAVVAVATPMFLRRPQLGLLALVAVTPFNGLLLMLPAPGLLSYWEEIVTVAVFGATFVAPASARATPGRRRPGWFPALAGFAALAVASAVVVGGAQGIFGLKITLFYALALWAVWRCPFNARERDLLVTILVTVGLITAVIGLGQQAIGPARLNALGFPYNSTIRFAGGFMRSFSTFIQPFGFGFFLMIVLLVGVPAALEQPNRLRSRLFLFASPIYGLALVTTIVRGAWLGVAVGVAYLAASRYKFLLLGIPVALIAVLFVPPEAAAPAFSDASSVERADGWRANANRVAARPLGEGIGSTGSAALAVERLGGDALTYQTDNYYFKVILELGILGLWMFLLLLAAGFSEARRTSRTRDGPDAALASAVAATILAAAVASLVASYLDILPMDLLFWLLLGVSADLAASRSAVAIDGELARKPRSGRSPLPK